jgi:hypothetical protein
LGEEGVAEAFRLTLGFFGVKGFGGVLSSRKSV